ncbi:MAG TPA: DUF6580 family putative transport protein [Candidatus Bathyarchaeia archaeon]|nr:DUF6580 family putative transport protein [Candidatus Bathyarchaeia archaeon]
MLAYLFVVLAVAVHIRWIALPFSFTPVIAALLYFGARMPRKQMWIPVAMLVASDVYLTRVTYGYPITADHFVTWGFYAAMILLGGAMIKGFSALRIGATTIIGSVSFFVVSNFAVWMVWQMYPKTLGGLTACYVAGLPFFRNAVVSDLLFSAAFFGIGYLVSQKTAAREAIAVSRR